MIIGSVPLGFFAFYWVAYSDKSYLIDNLKSC